MALVFNIQRFSVNDGPGIRTTVFLKGCPLKCLWCHNPESQSFKKELCLAKAKCIGCGRCLDRCPGHVHSLVNGQRFIDRAACLSCGACGDFCPTGALCVMGEDMTADEVIGQVMRDEPFYKTSGGGMTVSGGEPMSHFAFLVELLKAARAKGLHTAIETSGYAPPQRFEAIKGLVDLYLYDWKETDPDRHKAYTGVDNALIRQNLYTLNARGEQIVLRCPIIPGYNDREDHFAGIAALAQALEGIQRVDVEPYHPLGQSKSENLGREYALKDVSFPDEDTVRGWISAIAARTDKPVGKA